MQFGQSTTRGNTLHVLWIMEFQQRSFARDEEARDDEVENFGVQLSNNQKQQKLDLRTCDK